MPMTPEQFDEVRKVLERYNYRHQPDNRGPGCRACARVDSSHAAKNQPVCLTVSELLYDLDELIEVPPEKLVSPKRALELTMEIGADDLPSMIRLLDYLRTKVAKGDLACWSGGVDSGGRFQVEHHPEQTHEKWEGELNVYLAKLEKQEAGEPK